MRWALLLFLPACLPAPHELVGRPCDAQGRCPDPLICVASVCVESSDGGAGGGGSAANVAPNGGFEEAGLQGWGVAWANTTTLSLQSGTKRSLRFFLCPLMVIVRGGEAR